MLKIRKTISKESFVLIKRIIFVQIVFGIIFPVAGFFIDEKALENTNSFFQIISVELSLTILVTFIDVITIIVIFLHWQKETYKPQKSLKSVIKGYISKGESKKIEFKETLRWDTITESTNRDLERVFLKTTAGFLNAEGGNLIVGINDKQQVIGLLRDYQTLPKKNNDGFQNHIIQLIKQGIGVNQLANIDIHFEKFNGNEICLVKIRPSTKPVFVTWNGSEEFFVRNGNTTNPLSIKEAVTYIEEHWKKEEPKKKPFLRRLF